MARFDDHLPREVDELPWYANLEFQRDVLKLASPVLDRQSARGAGFGAVPSARRYQAGLIGNGKSHRNKKAGKLDFPIRPGSNVLTRHPQTIAELTEALLEFASAGVDLIIVDGGDGTLRNVVTCAARIFSTSMPHIAILPGGKTNAVAQDLGIPNGWSASDALAAHARGATISRSPVEIVRAGSTEPALRGFLFGAGAFVRATSLAQNTHRMGAFDNLAVGASLVAAIGQTIFASKTNSWRRGERMRIGRSGNVVDAKFYLLLVSTLKSLPMDIQPFGDIETDLRTLAVDAPPQKLVRSLLPLLRGSADPVLAERGYHHIGVPSFELELESGFILDGELYQGGKFQVRRGDPIHFVKP